MSLSISYAQTDRSYAQELSQALRSRGFDVFRDDETLIAGENYADLILDALKNAELVVFVVPKKAGKARMRFSKWVRQRLWGKGFLRSCPTAGQVQAGTLQWVWRT